MADIEKYPKTSYQDIMLKDDIETLFIRYADYVINLWDDEIADEPVRALLFGRLRIEGIRRFIDVGLQYLTVDEEELITINIGGDVYTLYSEEAVSDDPPEEEYEDEKELQDVRLKLNETIWSKERTEIAAIKERLNLQYHDSLVVNPV